MRNEPTKKAHGTTRYVMVRMYGQWLCVSSTGSLARAIEQADMWKRQGYKAEVR